MQLGPPSSYCRLLPTQKYSKLKSYIKCQGANNMVSVVLWFLPFILFSWPLLFLPVQRHLGRFQKIHMNMEQAAGLNSRMFFHVLALIYEP